MTETIAEFISRASAGPVEIKVKKLLAVWEVGFRSWENVARIRGDLDAAGLGCIPDFAEGSLNSVVRVSVAPPPTPGATPEEAPDAPLQLPPATLLIKDVPSANREVKRVSPDQTLGEVQALLHALPYSQLAVMAGDRDLKGAVSWQSIAQAQIRCGLQDVPLHEATVKVPEVRPDDELLRQLPVICAESFVFVRGDDDRICGIVTVTDLATKFEDLTQPYFQLGEIERRLRRCIDKTFSADQLQEATGKDSPNDMVFGNYLTLLDDEDRWKQMKWGVDRTMFIGYLDTARQLRNRVMHFGRELDAQEKDRLMECLRFMRALDPFP